MIEAAPNEFEIYCVDRITKALERVKHERFDVIVLDLMLPDGQGLESFLELHRHIPDVPIVVLTGLGYEALAANAMAAGARGYLVKGEVQGQEFAETLRDATCQHGC